MAKGGSTTNSSLCKAQKYITRRVMAAEAAKAHGGQVLIRTRTNNREEQRLTSCCASDVVCTTKNLIIPTRISASSLAQECCPSSSSGLDSSCSTTLAMLSCTPLVPSVNKNDTTTSSFLPSSRSFQPVTSSQPENDPLEVTWPFYFRVLPASSMTTTWSSSTSSSTSSCTSSSADTTISGSTTTTTTSSSSSSSSSSSTTPFSGNDRPDNGGKVVDQQQSCRCLASPVVAELDHLFCQHIRQQEEIVRNTKREEKRNEISQMELCQDTIGGAYGRIQQETSGKEFIRDKRTREKSPPLVVIKKEKNIQTSRMASPNNPATKTTSTMTSKTTSTTTGSIIHPPIIFRSTSSTIPSMNTDFVPPSKGWPEDDTWEKIIDGPQIKRARRNCDKEIVVEGQIGVAQAFKRYTTPFYPTRPEDTARELEGEPHGGPFYELPPTLQPNKNETKRCTMYSIDGFQWSSEESNSTSTWNSGQQHHKYTEHANETWCMQADLNEEGGGGGKESRRRGRGKEETQGYPIGKQHHRYNTDYNMSALPRTTTGLVRRTSSCEKALTRIEAFSRSLETL